MTLEMYSYMMHLLHSNKIKEGKKVTRGLRGIMNLINVNYLSITEYMRFLTAIVYSSYFPLSMKFYIVYCKY